MNGMQGDGRRQGGRENSIEDARDGGRVMEGGREKGRLL